MAPRFVRPKNLSMFRTMAAVSWDPPRDPTIYGGHEVDAEALMAYLADLRAKTGVKVTPTHAVVRAFALTLARNPGLNCTIRRGKLWQRTSADLFCQVAVPDESGEQDSQSADLSGVMLRSADQLSTVGVALEVQRKAERIRAKDDPMLAATKKNLSWMPPSLMYYALKTASYLSHDVGLDLRWAGIPVDPFGSLMVTSLGMLGVTSAYAPMFPSAKGLGAVLVGQAHDAPMVIDGEVVARKMLPVMVTLDHRVVDGFQASVLARDARRLLEDPATLDEGMDIDAELAAAGRTRPTGSAEDAAA